MLKEQCLPMKTKEFFSFLHTQSREKKTGEFSVKENQAIPLGKTVAIILVTEPGHIGYVEYIFCGKYILDEPTEIISIDLASVGGS